MLAVGFMAFLLFQYVGDPVVFMLGQDVTPEKVAQLRAELGLDQPFFVQFFHFIVNAAQGDFGVSLRQGGKVSNLIIDRLPATLELAMAAAMLALLVGAMLAPGARTVTTASAGRSSTKRISARLPSICTAQSSTGPSQASASICAIWTAR